MKKLISILLFVVLLFSFASCAKTPANRLSTPQSVTVVNGVINWQAVPNAESYKVIVNGVEHSTTETYFVADSAQDFTCRIVAVGKGYYDSLPSKEVTYTLQKMQLATPTNVKVNVNGKISWNAVANATGYVVTVNNEKFTVSATFLEVGNTKNFVASVVAIANGYLDSASSSSVSYTATNKPAVDPDAKVTIAIDGASQLYSGKPAKLNATVNGANNTAVTWQVTQGADVVSVDSAGNLTVSQVEGNKIVSVTATSVADPTVSATKVLEVVAKTTLTQDMIDAIASTEKVAFEGYITIDLYEFKDSIYNDPDKKYSNVYMTSTTTIKTAMDGTNWYAQYTVDMVKQNMYVKNNGGNAAQVSVSFTNQDECTNIETDDGQYLSWADSGYYNVFQSYKQRGELGVDDFTFDETTWRWKYTGGDAKFAELLLDSCNPYDFSPKDIWLIIDNGEILGIYSQSKDDFSLATGYYGVQNLYVAMDTNEAVTVPTISKYNHWEKHDALTEAIQNMQALTSYKTNVNQLAGGIYSAGGYTQEGYEEIVTPNDCYFVPYTYVVDGDDNYVYTYDYSSDYGYHKVTDSMYNAYYKDQLGAYRASRAYEQDISNAKPSFEFAAEIFRQYYDNEDGSTTYYVDDVMAGVASTFYFGLGNDIALYGIYASADTMTGSTFAPYVTVKDGYIVEAGYYYYLGYLYGVMIINYSDFNNATVPTEVVNALNDQTKFTVRQVPDSWEDLTIIHREGDENTGDDVEVQADTLLRSYFNLTDASVVPFIGNAIGDTFGYAMTDFRIVGGVARRSVTCYYDVPLDINYSIDSSLDKITSYLKELSFQRNSNGEYYKTITDASGANKTLYVQPVDSSLDLFVYIWLV